MTDEEETTTGLPWPFPGSWRGAYSLVLASFLFWLVLLIVLGTVGQ